MKYYITCVDSAYVTYPIPTLVRCNNKKEAREKTVQYWDDEDIKKNHISVYEINDKFFDGDDITEIPFC